MTREEFVKAYYPLAEAITKGTGIFPLTLLSQAIVESSGKVGGIWIPGQSTLSKLANNYFGIKASLGWKGATIALQTGEVIDGKKVTITGTFRKYPSVEDSFRDYVKFLKENPRYEKSGVFQAKDVSDQAKRLQAAGYATDPNYATLISSIASRIRSFVPTIIKPALVSLPVIFFLTYLAIKRK